MTKRIVIPGSRGPEAAEFGRSRGRFTEDEANTLAEMIRWWRHRRAIGDSADPLESFFGGVDSRFVVRTVGLAPATAVLPKPLLPGGNNTGVSLWVQALGVPVDVVAAGEVYALVAVGHIYEEGGGYYSRHTTIGRTPASTTSTEFRTAVSGVPPNQTPVLQLVGVSGLTIDWTVEVARLEV